MGRYFGTDGFRGEANVDLTADHAYKTGRFLGWYYSEKNRINANGKRAKIVIGKDTRRSSYMFEYALAAGITASGADAYLLHVTTTPSVAYVTRVDGFDCGIMISASHNPYFDNGIKLISSDGEKFDDDATDKIEAYLDCRYEREIPFATGENVGRTVDYIAGRNRYIGYLISLGVYSFRGLRVGIDCANGSAWNIAKAVFEALGAETHVINAKPDGVNINKDCGSTHIEALRDFVVDNSLDIGFAYDGDCDRCLCVDEKGNLVTGDHILFVCGRYLKNRNELDNNTVVTTVMSNFGLYKAFDSIGVEYAKTAVGDRFVYEYMLKHGNRLGGEESGHIIFSKYATTGDGILTSLKLMEVMIASKKPMSELCKGMTLYPQTLINVKVSDKKAVRENYAVNEAVKEAEKILGNNGRILVRESGTEPVVRVMVEAESRETCEKCAHTVADIIQSQGL